jgi:sugar lactone lactonase YvrE
VSDGRLWVSGADSGEAYVYDAKTGATLATYTLASAADGPTFINDVVVTRRAAWFTDSQRAVLYRVPIGRHGEPGDPADVKTVPLTGDYVQGTGFNVNGIDATRDGRWLIIVQSNVGALYRVHARSGVADRIELQGGDVAMGDGILLDGRKLFVVQNRLHRVAVVKLDRRLGSGTIVKLITSPNFDVPTTITEGKRGLYVVNARFGVADPANATYTVARVPGTWGHGHGHGHGHHHR